MPPASRKQGPVVKVSGTALRAGDLLHITRAASVQFVRPIILRLIRVEVELTTFDGWVWLEGYQLDPTGKAVDRRKIFVRPTGLTRMRRESRFRPHF